MNPFTPSLALAGAALVVFAMVRPLWKFKARTGTPKALKRLVGKSRSGYWTERRQAVYDMAVYFAEHPDTKKALTFVTLNDGDPDVRKAAKEMLEKINGGHQ